MYSEAMEHLIATPATSPDNSKLRQQTGARNRGSSHEFSGVGETTYGSAQPTKVAEDITGREGVKAAAGAEGGANNGSDTRGGEAKPANEKICVDPGAEGGNVGRAESLGSVRPTRRGPDVSWWLEQQIFPTRMHTFE